MMGRLVGSVGDGKVGGRKKVGAGVGAHPKSAVAKEAETQTNTAKDLKDPDAAVFICVVFSRRAVRAQAGI